MSRNALSSEKASYTDAETGRRVTLWTAPGAGHSVGLYYHQNPFDGQRNLGYFVSDRTGSWRLWRADMDDGGLLQVSDFEGLGSMLAGSTGNQGGGDYWVHVRPAAGECAWGERPH